MVRLLNWALVLIGSTVIEVMQLNLFKVAFVEAIKRGIQEIHLATGHPAACQIAQQLGFKIRKGGKLSKSDHLFGVV